MIPAIDPYVILVAIIAIFLAILSALSILIAIRNNRRKQDRQPSPERQYRPSRSPVRSSLASQGRNDLPAQQRSLAIPSHPDLPRSPVRSSQSLASRSNLASPSSLAKTKSPSQTRPVSDASYETEIRTDINTIINKHLSKEPTQ